MLIDDIVYISIYTLIYPIYDTYTLVYPIYDIHTHIYCLYNSVEASLGLHRSSVTGGLVCLITSSHTASTDPTRKWMTSFPLGSGGSPVSLPGLLWHHPSRGGCSTSSLLGCGGSLSFPHDLQGSCSVRGSHYHTVGMKAWFPTQHSRTPPWWRAWGFKAWQE